MYILPCITEERKNSHFYHFENCSTNEAFNHSECNSPFIFEWHRFSDEKICRIPRNLICCISVALAHQNSEPFRLIYSGQPQTTMPWCDWCLYTTRHRGVCTVYTVGWCQSQLTRHVYAFSIPTRALKLIIMTFGWQRKSQFWFIYLNSFAFAMLSGKC